PGRLVQPLHLPGRLSRPDTAIADYLEGADLWADGRHRRCADDVAAGEARWQQKLGLSLLLAARRHLYAAGADELRLHRRSLRLAQLAIARCGGFTDKHADHVRHHGQPAAAGMGGGLAARL